MSVSGPEVGRVPKNYTEVKVTLLKRIFTQVKIGCPKIT